MALNSLQLAVVCFLTVLAVRLSLRSLSKIAEALKTRDAFDASPLSVHGVPREVHPLIVAFNSLLGKVELAVHAERNFRSDAAHELRTPLSVVHAQAEIARRLTDAKKKDAALDKLLLVSRAASAWPSSCWTRPGWKEDCT